MATIEEDYVSFEVAKLLKEKGFQAKCTACYHNDQSHTFKLISGRINYCNPKFNKYKMIPPYNAPTLQMAMKWLREIHNCIITIDYDSYENADDSGVTIGYSFSLQKKENPSEYEYIHDWAYDTYEEAVDAAIRRTLENIITPIPNS